MSARHRLDPLDLDMSGAWDGVVKWSNLCGQFIRFSDRNGEVVELVAEEP